MVFLTAIFASYELALASVRLDRLKILADQKRRGAATALRMKNRMEASLAVAQLGMTLFGLIAGATGGANIESSLSPLIQANLHVSGRVADLIALICFVIPLAALTTVVGELVPKVLGIKNAEWVCLTLSPAMRAFGLVVYPAVWLFEGLTTTLVRLIEGLFPTRQAVDHQTPLPELRAQVNLLRASQVIGLQEERIMLQASRLSTAKVKDIMMPEDDIVMV